ncbi:MAG: TonB-dependent receptor [Sediminibacterium sp.]|nr:TonB-dependent receptor [Sediminibacterium sp.]
MPRIAFAFPISDVANFFAHYDVLTQRPPSFNRLDPLQYLNVENNQGGFVNNPDLKPEKTIDYELGFAQVLNDGTIDLGITQHSLKALHVDEHGLDEMDNRILAAIIDKFKGGPVGITTIATAVGEESGTLEEVYEPFLIQEGFLQRTPRGREATAKAYQHLGKQDNRGGIQPDLFS